MQWRISVICCVFMWTMQCLWDDEHATTWIAAATMANNIRPLVIYRYSCARHECRARVIRYIAEVKTTANSSDNGDRRYWSMTLERTSTYCFSRWNWFDYSVPALGERSIVMSLSVCLCVCVSVCACLHVQNYRSYLYQWPCLSPPVAELRYFMYFRFYEWRHVCT